MKFINKGNKIDTDGIMARFNQVLIDKGLSQYDVADMTDVTRAMIGHLSTGRRGFNIEIACKICKGLDIDFIWFITGVKVK